MARITIHVPDQEPLEIDLDGYEQLSIGRGPDNDVVIDHVSLSGSHAIIRQAGGAFQLVDQQSTNGTYLGGEPVSEVTLEHGAQVAFGSVEAVFTDESVAGAGEEASAPAGGGSGYGTHGAELSDASNKPSGFKNLSPIEKVEKKDTLSVIAMTIGVVAILAAVAVVVLSTMMSAA